MSLLNIDDRLAGLAEAATRAGRPRHVVVPTHPRRMASATSPQAPVARMLELSGSIVEALASGDVAALGSLCTDDVHVRTPTFDAVGRDALAGRMRAERCSYSEIDVDVRTLIAAGPSFAVEWRLHARHSDAIDVGWAHVEATGQSITLDGTLIARVDDGPPGQERLDDGHLTYDTTSLLLQLALA